MPGLRAVFAAAAVLIAETAALDVRTARRGLDEAAEAAIEALDMVKGAAQRAAQPVGGEMRFRSEQREQVGAAAAPGIECTICEDAVQTWRETFPCTGNFEPDWTPDTSVDMNACRVVPTCSHLPTEFTDSCTEYKESVKTQAVDVWRAVMARQNPYEICSGTLSPAACRPVTEDDGKLCYEAILSENCRDNPFCEEVKVACEPACFGCFWSVKSFPAFREACAPAGTNNEAPYAPEPGSDYASAGIADSAVDEGTMEAAQGAALIEERSALRSRRLPAMSSPPPPPSTQTTASQGGASQGGEAQGGAGGSGSDILEDPRKLAGRGSPPLTKAEVTTSGDDATRMKNCFAMWDEIQFSPKARYFASFASALGDEEWDANTVCKCLGKCTYDSMEALRLMPRCTYERSLARDVLLFPDIADRIREESRMEADVEGQGSA